MGTPGVPDAEDAWEGQDWLGIVNQVGFGANSWWTFLNAHPANAETGNGNDMTMRYGFSVPKVDWLNPLYANEYWDWEILGKIYDSGARRNPYNLGEWLPQLYDEWEPGTWVDPVTAETKSKVTITMRPDATWMDGYQVTVADIEFTLIEVSRMLLDRGLPPPSWYPSVEMIKSFAQIDPYRIEILLDVLSFRAVEWVISNIVIPKHIWKPILQASNPANMDTHPYAHSHHPDVNLIGTGPYRLVSYQEAPSPVIVMLSNKPGRTITTSILTETGTPTTNPFGYYLWVPKKSKIGTVEYGSRSKIPVDATTGVSLPVTIRTIDYGLLYPWVVAEKTVILEYPNGTKVTLFTGVENEIYSQPWYSGNAIVETFGPYVGPYVFPAGRYRVYVLKHIIAPAPFASRWLNETKFFWFTLPEDIAGTFPDTLDYNIPIHSTSKQEIPVADFKVDVKDLNIVAKAYGSYPGHPRWNSICDINGDYKVNATDVNLVGWKWGWMPGVIPITPMPDVAVTSVKPSKTAVGQGYIVPIDVALENQGNVPTTFDLRVFANTTPIYTADPVTLETGSSSTIEFNWNTSGFAKGNYAISAYITPVIYETDTTDNTYTNGNVAVAMIGDITGPTPNVPDGRVDIRDIATVAIHFGHTPPDGHLPSTPEYIACFNADITGPTIGVPDGQVDIRDIATIAIRFGQIDP